jgi:hypothetical protein
VRYRAQLLHRYRVKKVVLKHNQAQLRLQHKYYYVFKRIYLF